MAFENAEQYAANCAYVWQHGMGVVELLAPQAGEHILDLGCGTGALTAEIAKSGAHVLGYDGSASMIDRARAAYPELHWEVADARDFTVPEPQDAVFSNAVLHWVKPPQPAAACIFRALRPGGRFVAEMGGHGNVGQIVAALDQAFATAGMPERSQRNPWYFPSIAEYATLLEQTGFEVQAAWLFDRTTKLHGHHAGMRQWVEAFATPFFEGLSAEQIAAITAEVEERLRPTLYRDETWIGDYRRLRIVARKPE